MTDKVSSQGVVASDPQNNSSAKGVHTRSSFSDKDLGYPFFATLPFGEVRPFTAFEAVPDDKNVRFQSISKVNSFTMKAPLMQGIHMKKMLCQVPREAILPFNWDKWFKNPVIGQDVPGDVGTSFLGFWHRVYEVMDKLMIETRATLPGLNPSSELGSWLTRRFKLHLIAELFYSDGNLLKHCGISGSPWGFSFKQDGHTHNTVDYMFDKFIGRLLYWFESAGIPGFVLSYSPTNYYSVEFAIDPNRQYSGPWVSLREALSLMRDDLNFSIDLGVLSSAQITKLQSFYAETEGDIELLLVPQDDNPLDPADSVPVDLKRLWAYQLCCAHFLTNDSVDFVYTAELYRQYIWELVSQATSFVDSVPVKTFSVNGFDYQYDFLSAHYLDYIFVDIDGDGFSAQASSFAYLSSLFSFKRSLRYLDYFTGSKTRPLAVGDVNVQVNNNLVNVVDTTAKSFLARFLNVINRSGMRNYVESVFNVRQAPDWHNPQFLVKIDDIVSGQRVENTGDAQWNRANSVTSLLHGSSDRFAFDMDFDRSSVVIGLVWFDIDRVYSRATERQNLHYDRFDEFQPFMQYTGDQALMRVELGTPSLGNGDAVLPFGYKLRNSEYKERYAQCAGGFCNDALDGYIFKADVLEAGNIQNQGPSFIRSFPSELDRFYLSLSGYSLATYFHFIVEFDNLWSASRPMAYAPTLM